VPSDRVRAFGLALRQLRLERELSQEGLADRTGLHVTYVSGIERGIRNPALKNILKLADALEVSLTELFGRVERHATHAPSESPQGPL
jgi:transcriptional regulator with XRE-family HTH domain